MKPQTILQTLNIVFPSKKNFKYVEWLLINKK